MGSVRGAGQTFTGGDPSLPRSQLDGLGLEIGEMEGSRPADPSALLSFSRAAGPWPRASNTVSRTSAEELGNLAHVVIDVKRRQVAWLVVGKGRKALLIDWEQVSGFGPDAVMVADESVQYLPRDDRERAAADGKLELVGKRALSDMGNDLGTVTDVQFDPVTGASKAWCSAIGRSQRHCCWGPARSP
jgi:sporulation protein YlmC with PRC-barrel domain